MPNWSASAHETLRRHLEIARQHAAHTGADPDEVEADIRAHVETELRHLPGIVTQIDVETVLNRLGVGDPASINSADLDPAPDVPYSSPITRLTLPLSGAPAAGAAWLFGVVTPFATVVFEAATGSCRELFADPFPTWLHVLLILCVPTFNALGLVADSATSRRKLKFLQHANTCALAISSLYALAFLYITPFAIVGIIALGLGFLPLSPLTSFIVALRLRKRLRLLGETAELMPPRWWPRLLQFAALLIALELPSFLTHRAITTLAAEPQATGWHLSWLRTWPWQNTFDIEAQGDRTLINGHTAGTLLAEMLWQPLAARSIAIARYRADGLETVVRPRRPFLDNISSWDWQQGTDNVGKILPTLFLKQSTLDGVIDAKAAHGYLEWTLVFRNDDPWRNAEARCQIALPTGGTVSRLTLWIEGEPREAAFGGRSTVKQAYQKVVQVLRRDPALVTTSGPDRILLQCFPILPKGQEMKLRIGITYPLQLGSSDPSRANFLLPRFIEQNFRLEKNTAHKLWFESWGAMQADSPALKPAAGEQAGSHSLRGVLADLALADDRLGITVHRSPADTFTWTEGLEPSELYAQQIQKIPATARPLALVVDGSTSMKNEISKLCAALRANPDVVIHQTLLASDTLVTCPENNARKIADWLARQTYVGGQDNTDALTRAAEYLLTQNTPSMLLWIHGPQTETWQNSGALHQLFERRPGQVQIVEAALVAGPNRLIPPTPNPISWAALPRSESLQEDIGQFLRHSLGGEHWQLTRTRLAPAHSATFNTSDHTTSHLRRLAVLDEVNLLYSRNEIDAAGALAARHELVTAVSGAVVLETKQQYDEAGLKPSTGSPAIPEPGTYALCAALGLLVLCLRRKLHFSSRGKLCS